MNSCFDRSFGLCYRIERCLGNGAFSRVYGGTYQGMRVAVKQLTRDLITMDVIRFINETSIMRELEHPNVVRFVGVVWEPR